MGSVVIRHRIEKLTPCFDQLDDDESIHFARFENVINLKELTDISVQESAAIINSELV